MILFFVTNRFVLYSLEHNRLTDQKVFVSMQAKIISQRIFENLTPKIPNETPHLEFSREDIEALIKEAIISLATLAQLSNISLAQVIQELLDKHEI